MDVVYIAAGLAFFAALAALVVWFDRLAALVPDWHWSLVLVVALLAGSVALIAVQFWLVHPLVNLLARSKRLTGFFVVMPIDRPRFRQEQQQDRNQGRTPWD